MAAKKLVCLKNFHCKDMVPPKKGEEDKKRVSREWQEGEEYTGEDDTARLLEEGLVGYPAAKKGKKTSADLEEGEAMDAEGNEVDETTPPDGSETDEGDGEEEAPVKAKPKAARRGKKKTS